jgi:hypothetical protein
MSLIVVKPDPERDWYVIWCTITDAVAFEGTRKRVTEELIADRVEQARETAEREVPAACDRADSAGTSDRRNRITPNTLLDMQGNATMEGI